MTNELIENRTFHDTLQVTNAYLLLLTTVEDEHSIEVQTQAGHSTAFNIFSLCDPCDL